MPLLESTDEVVRQALREDIGPGDLTADLLPKDLRSSAQVITRENAILCGTRWFDTVFHQLDGQIQIDWHATDGDEIHAGQILCHIQGPTRPLLSAERTALNFLQTLSGTATLTHEYAQALQDTTTKLLDTRKTIPGLREAQKYAVRCGGGCNHRLGLFDGILLKENHILAIGSIAKAIESAKQRYSEIPVEVEVQNIEELREALDAGTDLVLLDNFSIDAMREAVAIATGRAGIEASGSFDLQQLREAAQTGVDYISVGALTKHVRAIDLSMRFLPQS